MLIVCGSVLMFFEAVIKVLKFFLAVTMLQLVHSLSNASSIYRTLGILTILFQLEPCGTHIEHDRMLIPLSYICQTYCLHLLNASLQQKRSLSPLISVWCL